MLKIFNSLSRQKEEFKPLRAKKVGIYVCGPTVYSPDHLGHARTWVFFDWLRRFFELQKFQVKFVQNITDVGHLVGDSEEGEDKIEKEAKARGKTPQEIARYYERAYFDDLESLNILKPDFSPRATEHIEDIIKFIEVLISKKHAYEVSGNVYFNISSFPEYGKLSSRKIDEEIAGVRIKTDPRKKSPADFALWLKADLKHLQKWPSPWGLGFPAWHIECSVLSNLFLSQPFDIHGGANDLVFPHHENEIAQSWGYSGKPLARYFLHSGILLIDGQKMAKSLNNFITVQDVLRDYDTDTIKLVFMTTHWRKPLDWPARRSLGVGGSKTAVLEAEKLKVRLVRAKVEAQPVKTGFPTEINRVLEDDFNVPKALAIIMKNLSKLSRKDFEYIEKLFGLELQSVIKLTSKQKKLVQSREKLREKGVFSQADEIRKRLEKEGIIVEDTAAGPRIIKKP